jgi:hypothetical protein
MESPMTQEEETKERYWKGRPRTYLHICDPQPVLGHPQHILTTRLHEHRPLQV